MLFEGSRSKNSSTTKIPIESDDTASFVSKSSIPPPPYAQDTASIAELEAKYLKFLARQGKGNEIRTLDLASKSYSHHLPYFHTSLTSARAENLAYVYKHGSFPHLDPATLHQATFVIAQRNKKKYAMLLVRDGVTLVEGQETEYLYRIYETFFDAVAQMVDRVAKSMNPPRDGTAPMPKTLTILNSKVETREELELGIYKLVTKFKCLFIKNGYNDHLVSRLLASLAFLTA
ncbi:hypothetical protein EJ02DRAFT_432922 [Clathrospora elynae]|uniref:Uncharacterized protein n=1 Tax=Clathrospora elynae TaxID=706981 RepID=A0A6A5SV32_9PLEO|nr:hypothetical protein EJ02DRAFT_432922 [Clathrospora elynae]